MPGDADDAVSAILAVRSNTHGDFSDNARIAQSTKELWRSTPNWVKLSAHQREALDLIALKVSRILSGDFNCEEHWHDLAGYSTLIARRLAEKQMASAGAPPGDTARNVGSKSKRGVRLSDDYVAYIGDHVIYKGSGAIGIIADLSHGAGQVEVEWLGQPDDRLIRPNRNRVSWRDLCKGSPE